MSPGIIATANIGGIVRIAAAAATPVVHTVELLDQATDGSSAGRAWRYPA